MSSVLSSLSLLITAPFRKHIKYKLFFAFMLTITIPVISYGILSYKISSANVEEDYSRLKAQLIEQASSLLDEDIWAITQQSMMIYNYNLHNFILVAETPPEKIDAAYMDAYSQIDNYFSSVLQTNSKVDGITLLSLDGKIKYHVDRQYGDFSLKSFDKENWFRQALSLKGLPLLREPHPNELVNSRHVSRSPVISIVRTQLNLQSKSNTPYGVLALNYNIDNLQKSMIKSAQTNDMEQIFMLGENKNVLFSNHSNNKLSNNILNELKNKGRGSFKDKTENLLVTYFESPKTGWQIVSLLPETVLKEKSKFLKNTTISLLFILIVLIFLLSIFTALFITKPLRRLMLHFRAFQKGDFDAQIRVKGEDELSQISQTFNYMVVNIRNLITERYEIKLLQNQSELKALQNQINPHFLYNTLTSIKEVVHDKNHEYAVTMIQHLSDIFRYNLSKSEHVVPLSIELEYIQKYLALQEFRFMDKFRVFFDIDDDVLNNAILRLTLQPIVENALVHGLYPQRNQQGELRIIAKSFSDSYYIYIQDNGVGMSADKVTQINHNLELDPATLTEAEWGGLGILNVNARIKYYFGSSYGLQYISKQNEGTTVKITLPIVPTSLQDN